MHSMPPPRELPFFRVAQRRTSYFLQAPPDMTSEDRS